MALQKTLSMLLLLLLTLLGLEVVQPSYGQPRYLGFLLKHVDSTQRGGTSSYCNRMMQIRGMTRPTCKQFNTFIHADNRAINDICRTPNIKCRNGSMNCHARVMSVTDCNLTASSRGNCRYQGRASSRRIVIACDGNPPVPVHFDR